MNGKIPDTDSFIKKTTWDSKQSAAVTDFITKTETESKNRSRNLEKREHWER